ncbi:RNI-like protein [Gautieria morchelliformis]|nr:RNI-like protein [Gautieria morchelliformis]
MSKRPAGTSRAGPSAKRTKSAHSAFGGPSADDQDPLTSQLTAPSSTALSIRSLPTTGVPTLITLCARVFVANLEFLFRPERREATKEGLKRLPDTVIPRLFSLLSASHPSLLSHPFISTFFLRGDPMVLTGSLPGVSSLTVQALSKLDPSLRELRLTALDKVSDAVVSRLLSGFPMLEVLILRGSTKLGKRTVEAAAKACKKLRAINLSYTSAPPASIALLTAECVELEVLKLAGVRNITDATFAMILHQDTGSTSSAERLPLACLRSLKLRHTLISEISLSRAMSHCRALSRLDVCFTPIRKLPVTSIGSPPLALEKLSLTSTPLTSSFLRTIGASQISAIFVSLHTLQIGALGASPSSSISTVTDSLTLTDPILESLNDLLVDCRVLERISLVGNTKLGVQTGVNSALANFVRKVGRRCKILNLAGIPRLKSSDLVGLLPLREGDEDSAAEEDSTAYAPSPLHTLVLNNTDVGDAAVTYIASCTELSTLEIAGTKFGYDSLFHILDSCTRLTTLDLTSCRGVRVGDRRRFFEKWRTLQVWQNRENS